jgi:hypothetical protein
MNRLARRGMIELTGTYRDSRREFLRRAGQGGVLAGLAALVALAVRGRGVALPGACPESGPCGGCALLARCSLPAAVGTRAVTSNR